MVCGPCKIAGQHLERARAAPAPQRPALLALARGGHERCDYPANCPCQHRTALDAVNLPRL
jgi:hypothetical protein